ncbi:putative polyketide cyclase dehydrase protein [Phaeoacremonium minimum UCRPA7]|uniref:Putative polyketide cyclase dehydrase protein n=1 Tax=Phaeoacremonium minimum (strain UCR-PA7) TaxID=1286976 RepID=R8BHF7_PHAM7|nr:putative polyketide cyclase dehydrase protein [Phaeoacremonium minimum UCRPA7]EON98780.1 putative polyketide cyclase dehydrase protein [Phaeoacremonium minimum UCRPA7]
MASFTTSEPPVPRNHPGTLTTATTTPTPSFGGNGSFTLSCSTRIAASPDTCLGVLLKTGDYPSWNPLIPKVTMDAPPAHPETDEAKLPPAHLRGADYVAKGTLMTFEVHVELNPDKITNRTPIECTMLEPFPGERKGWRLAWKPTSFPEWFMRSERIQEVVDDGNGGTEYTCWETFYGPFSPVIRMVVGAKLCKGFEGWAEGMKKFAEGLEK